MTNYSFSDTTTDSEKAKKKKEQRKKVLDRVRKQRKTPSTKSLKD